ncbi:phage antirepressor N-terminal domain-containing protein [Lonsdalea britannica]|uniref:phage antirepressor N-terminal domain-containing protein n=1 Tax=Lonsdalea britannica TaxID=1082704 RepID=UPI0026EDF5A3|nr:phage antirepressor N-terminal domain-containing protein [Lonsdalea britannica]
MNSVAIADRTINVPFHGAHLYIVNHNGEAQTPMRPIVEGMGLDWASQFTKIKNRFKTSVVIITTQLPGDSQRREVVCLPLRKVAGWLHTINVGKVRPGLREKVARYQEECDDVLYEYWTKGEVKNPRKAKKVLSGKITPEQQEAIKQLVMTRGKALPKERQAKGMITLWSSLKSHFGCSYKDIGEEQFTEALSLAARVSLEGEFLGKQKSLPPNARIQFTDEELCELAWLCKYSEAMIAACKDIYPLLDVAEHRLASRFFSIGHEYPRTINRAREFLRRETSHIEYQPLADDNWSRVLPHLR